MPLILKESDRRFGQTIIWSLKEKQEFFENELLKTPLDFSDIKDWNPQRQLEWLCGRYLIHRFQEIPVEKLSICENGKPDFLEEDRFLSISHTDGLVGLQTHHLPVGLDIQIVTEKIHRVASKFCTERDYSLLGPYLDKRKIELITWNFKEAVYKAYGQGGVSYKDHILLKDVISKGSTLRFSISLKTPGARKKYYGRTRTFGPYSMVQVVEQMDE